MGGACMFTWKNGSEGRHETLLRLEERAIPQVDWTSPTNERTSVKKGKGGWRRQKVEPLLFLRPSVPSASAADGTQGANPQLAGNPNALTPVRFPRFPKLRTCIYVSLYQSGSLFLSTNIS
jgi:hypothetical protein